MAKRGKRRTAGKRHLAVVPSPGPALCGAAGGISQRSGEPCREPVREGQLCHLHSQSVVDSVNAKKKQALELLRDGKYLIETATAIDVGASTLWRWRKHDPEFDKECATIAAENDERRTVVVEESMYDRIVAGKAYPAETIFWLKNRAPHRWRDKISTELLGEDGKPQRISVTIIQQVLTRVEQGRAAIDSRE